MVWFNFAQNTFEMQLHYTGMLKICRTCIVLVMLLLVTGISDPSAQRANKIQTCKIISYNIRLDTEDDGVNAWPLRKERVVKLLKSYKPDVFGLQEAMFHQMEFISNKMPGYERVGLCRDDGKTEGEASPVYFNKSKFRMGRSGTFWLSETPSVVGSRGWDAACNRVVSWVELFPLKAGEKPFVVFNTHFDHMGEMARRNSAKLILHAVDSLAKDMNVIITGDFNSKPADEPIRIINESKEPKLLNARLIALKKSDPGYTFTGFSVKDHETEQIDYVFVNEGQMVSDYKVDERSKNGFYPSDHLAVIVTVIL